MWTIKTNLYTLQNQALKLFLVCTVLAIAGERRLHHPLEKNSDNLQVQLEVVQIGIT